MLEKSPRKDVMKSHRNFENFKVSDAIRVIKVFVLCLLSYFSSDFIGLSASVSACLPTGNKKYNAGLIQQLHINVHTKPKRSN